LNEINGILHKNMLGLRLKEKIFYQMDGWWKFTDGCITIPETPAPPFVEQFHEELTRDK
jgi:hypothetical protein